MIEVAQQIYKKLQDEISRKIFLSRMEYNITGNIKALRRLYDCIGLSKSILDKMICGNRVVVFGAGAYGRRLVELYPECSWAAFCDNNYKLQGRKELGLPIISMKDLKKYYADALVVISPCYCWEKIKNQCLAEKIKNDFLVLREIIDNVVGVQYFNCPSLKPRKEEIFVDAGVLDGLSTIDFLKWAGKAYKYSYLFEPNKYVIEQIKNNLQSIEYKLIDKGLWHKETSLNFLEGAGDNIGGFSVTEEINSGGSMVEVTTLDKELMGVPVTFIKMDIEGSEYNALLGGKI